MVDYDTDASPRTWLVYRLRAIALQTTDETDRDDLLDAADLLEQCQ